MTCEVTDGLLWFPAMPNWVYERCLRALLYAYPVYPQIAKQYSNGSLEFYSVNGLTNASVNALIADHAEDWGLVNATWVGNCSTNGTPIYELFWASDQTPSDDTEWYEYTMAAVYALAMGQQYATFITQTFVRAFEFGHYGRKPK